MSGARDLAKAALPGPLREWVVGRRADQRRRREHLEVYGPAATIDPAPLALLREAPLKTLTDPAALEELLPRLGLNDEQLDQFPEHLYPFTGRGLLHWQYPNQFSRYLIELSRHQVRNYLEIGTRHGGTFCITVEYLRRFQPLEWAVGVDLRPVPGLEAWAATQPGVESLAADSRSLRFRTLVGRREPIDLVLIDGDHSEAGCQADLDLLRERARLIAFHDIASELVPGVRAVWERFRAESADTFDFHEFTAQYPETQARTGLSLLGLGLAIRRS